MHLKQHHNFLQKIKVFVLAPSLITEDANINYYYDFSQSIEEYTKNFSELNVEWVWQPVTLNNYATIIESIAVNEKKEKLPVILNLCDGDEVNGTPGISIIHCIEKHQLLYTGADDYFYNITTSKLPMKKAFDKHHVPTAQWLPISNRKNIDKNIFEKLGTPIIVKPAVSGGSMGVGIKNIVNNYNELEEQIYKMFDGYRGWQLTSDGIIAEQFIDGPEYTVLIAGSYNKPETAIIYAPVERVFHHSLPDNEKFLSFDRLWEIYEDETPMPNNENFYEYVSPPISLHEKIKQISWNAYVAVKGKGYTRVDLRMDKKNGNIYVLEVNAQCGLSDDENYTSIGAILRLSNNTFKELIVHILEDAINRKKSSAKIVQVKTRKSKTAVAAAS
ncbi:MAG: ATP-grasp domain-containing protein [Bacteroidetes bacterium]|nr:ATP-grasp domain-containing protein [Bacteroidota bacterium]MBS1649031.1 ATP-grasp domain-containing protein [Bacteroidota bacterium]